MRNGRAWNGETWIIISSFTWSFPIIIFIMVPCVGPVPRGTGPMQNKGSSAPLMKGTICKLFLKKTFVSLFKGTIRKLNEIYKKNLFLAQVNPFQPGLFITSSTTEWCCVLIV